MPKLSDYIRFVASRSQGIDKICQMNTSHVTRVYYKCVVELPHAVLDRWIVEKGGGTDNRLLPTPQIDFDICPVCMIEFMQDCHTAIESLNMLT